MNKALLSLWLVATCTASTVIFSQIFSQSSFEGGDPVAELVVRTEPRTTVTDVAKNIPPAKNGRSAQASSPSPADPPAALVAQAGTADTESLASAPPNDNADYDWAEIERAGAYGHAGPSVDAAIVSILPVGKQLRILAYKNGWVQLQDTGGQSGWVYEKYVASIAAPSEQRQAASQPPPAPAPSDSRQAQSRARIPPLRAGTTPTGPASGPLPRWALGYDGSGPQASVETRGDRPQRAWGQRKPSFADLYLRQFYRGY